MAYLLTLLLVYVLNSDWWSGLLEHSILSSDWWESVLQGSVGAFLSLLGLFLVFRLTRRHDLDRDQRAREAEKRAETDKRTKESLASFQMLCLELMSDHAKERDEYPPGQDPVTRLLGALVIFSLREAPDYPNLDRWLTDHIGELTPWMQHEDGPVMGNIAAAGISGAIAGWVSEGRCDNSERLTEDSVSKIWKILREQHELVTAFSQKKDSSPLKKWMAQLGKTLIMPSKSRKNTEQSS